MANSTICRELARALLALAFVASGCGAPPATPPVLWAWDRAEDLTFLAPGEADVAYLAGTLYLSENGLRVTPRRGSLALPDGMARGAVVRLEAPPGTGTEPAAAEEVARAIEALVGSGANSLQIDFDATVDQRAFYRALLAILDEPGRNLSITALASWCLGDPWIAELPIAAAVPMLYRLGPDGPAIRVGLARGEDFRARVCRGNYGLSDDEPVPRLVRGRRLWLFSRRAWSRESFAGLLAAARAAELR